MADQQQLPHRTHCQKMQEPPKNIEEFLKLQNLDHWPKEIHLWESDELLHTMKKIKQDSSFTSIYTHLWGNVLRVDDAAMAMESRLAECSILLRNHASEIFEWNRIISRTISHGKLKQYKAFLKKYHKEKKIMLSDEMETKKDIEGCNFPGFRTNELTQLPRHLNAERIYLFILKAHNFDGKVFKIWRSHFLSEASIALLHDSFWWWFLHKFKVYPDCLAQAIYVTFQEAFPESSNLFNDEFKEDLGNNIFLWLSGLPPQKGFWTHWKLKELSTTTIHGSKKMPSKSIKDMIARNQEHLSASIDFNITKILQNPKAYTTPAFKEESRSSKLPTKTPSKGYQETL
ncbi:protein FAM227B [Cervus elaphus]|uniref:protein FAM227B n=1 Tax=Cervus canadensis TaxID=1574408 RepID=UPI001C9E88F8|nr:protein FAM227B [Cervus canadensis]XP_043776860.1 protein FAM227B [Cervus elaphus]